MSTKKPACIEFLPGNNFEQALDDIEGMERLWLIYLFHRNQGWKPKVMPPRGDKKRGLFATRSPHRPNSIGMSCVRLESREGRKLWVSEYDLLDRTPILDVKPYLPYADSFPDAKTGWLEGLEDDEFEIEWSAESEASAAVTITACTYSDLLHIGSGKWLCLI